MADIVIANIEFGNDSFCNKVFLKLFGNLVIKSRNKDTIKHLKVLNLISISVQQKSQLELGLV